MLKNLFQSDPSNIKNFAESWCTPEENKGFK